MRWFKPNLRSSLYALFGGGNAAEPPSTVVQKISTDDIREAMLMLADAAGGDHAAQVMRRIRYATDVEALWFIRSELMALLAGTYGEAAALEKIDSVSDMFEDLLPEGLRSRPSPLNASLRDSARHQDD